MAFDTADYICGQGDAELCAYAMDRATDAYNAWVDREFHVSTGPL